MRHVTLTSGRVVAVLLVSLLPILAVAAPDPPSNPSPTPGATDAPANPSLCVEVTDPASGALDVTFFARDLAAAPDEEFTIVAIPDSQNYAQMYHSIFYDQTEWIVANKDTRNIVFVSHMGDIVQQAKIPREWEVADEAMSKLEDPATTELFDGMPYGLCVGNHDQYPDGYPGSLIGQSDTTALYNEFFPFSRFEGKSWWGGHFGDNNDNSYQLFESGGMKFIAIHLEFDDRVADLELLDATLDWTEALLETYSDRRAIISSHSILCDDGFCAPLGAFTAQGQVIYDRVKHHPSVFLMLCGHQGTVIIQPRREDVFEGNTIHTTLQNYQRGQDCPYICGRGWLRLYTFKPEQDLIEARTYSPWLDEFFSQLCEDGSECHEFDLAYDMNGGIQFEEVGSADAAPSGSIVCADWPGRTTSGSYEWYVTVSDGADTVVGDRWTFTSDAACTNVADCDDGDACTQDSCAETCTSTPLANCCETAADCDDGNYCTDEVCNAGSCENPDNTNLCSDGDPCTVGDVCAAGTCSGVPLVCDDANGCTDDLCVDGECEASYRPTSSCCTADRDCNDGDHCTTDFCGTGGDCQNTLVPGCCASLADCPDDGDACTMEACPAWNSGSLVLNGGGDYVNMHRSFGLAEFTIECWFKWDGGGSPVYTYNWRWAWPFDTEGIHAYPLVTKGFADQEFGIADGGYTQNILSVNYFLGIQAPDFDHPLPVLAADFEEHSSGSAEYGLNHPVFGTTPIIANVWHHAAVTYDGSCWELYLNGQPETDGTNCPNEPPAFSSLMQFSIGSALDWNGGYLAHVIGVPDDLDQGWFSGNIDEVRIWDHARTAEEISENMNSAIASGPGLAGRWGLDGLKPGSEFLTEDAIGLHDGIVVSGNFDFNDFPDLAGGVCEAPVLLPAEVSGLTVAPSPDSVISWQDPGGGEEYDVASGLLSDLRADGGVDQAECVVDDHSGTTFVDTRPDPESGDGYYYMVRGVAGCGPGSYGFSSRGTERLPASACP